MTMLLHEPGAAPPGLGAIRCVALGSAAVVSQELADSCRHYITSVVLSTDPIPRLSCYTVSRPPPPACGHLGSAAYTAP